MILRATLCFMVIFFFMARIIRAGLHWSSGCLLLGPPRLRRSLGQRPAFFLCYAFPPCLTATGGELLDGANSAHSLDIQAGWQISSRPPHPSPKGPAMKAARNYPPPPWSYHFDSSGALVPPAYALVGKMILDDDGGQKTYQLVLENTATGEPATCSEMNAFMQAILNNFAPVL